MENKFPSIELNTTLCDRSVPQDETLGIFGSADTVEITAVISGGGIHKIMNESMECHAGDMYIFGGGVPHSYYAAEGEEPPTVISINFNVSEMLCGSASDKTLAEYCYGIFRDRSLFSYAMLNEKAMLRLKQAYADMETELNKKSTYHVEAVRSHLNLLLIFLGRYINQADTAKEEKPKEWMTVSSAIAEINERFGESDLTLESVAASLYISQSRLSRIFQKVTGESFPDYVRGVRLRHACDLLKNTELTNEEIVGRCGLKDVPAFYRIFKTAFGITPGKYRLEHSKTNNTPESQSILFEIIETVKRGSNSKISALINEAISEGISPSEIITDALIEGMNSIGERFKKNEVYVPEVLVAARATNTALSILKPLLSEGDLPFVGRVCIGSVRGDLHDIGKNLVKMMMEAKGLEVIDLGTDVATEKFITTAIENDCQVICCSALLTTTIGVLGEVVKLAEERGIRNKVKILVGGAPVSEEFARSIGADAYTPDAASAAGKAVELCKSLTINN